MNPNYHKYLSKRFFEIGESDLAGIVVEAIDELKKDMCKNVTDTEMAYLSQKVISNIKFKYKNWKVCDFLQCIEMGAIGNYHRPGMSSSLNASTIMSWLFQHSSRVQAQMISDNIEEQTSLRNTAAQAFTQNRNPLMAEAVLWRLNAIISLSSRNSKNGILDADYIEKKEYINNIPFALIVESVKSGNTKTLLPW